MSSGQVATFGAMLRAIALVLTGLCAAASAETRPQTVEEVLACLQRTRPLTNTARTIELVSRDRTGAERTQRARVYGGVSREGFRTLLVQVVFPPDLDGLTVLITEREGANHLFLSPAGLPEVRQIRGAPGQTSLLQTDFSLEDLERLYGLSGPGETHALAGTRTLPDGRVSWLVETTPAEPDGSAYRLIESLVDRETCVLLRAEMYESGREPRKVLTADPQSVSREGSTWVARDLVLRDLRDATETRMRISELALDAQVQGIPFSPEDLEQFKRSHP